MKVVIIGGVAGGASTAARLRRLKEDAEIIIVERGEHISYANCGLPYYIGAVIKEREKLFVMEPRKFRDWFNIEVRVNSEAVALDREAKKVAVKDLRTGQKYWESYDYLVLSPGAAPIRPPLPGIGGEAVFTLRSVADTDRIYRFLEEKRPARAVVVGGGFIGLEMAENLHARGLKVSIVEAAPQVLPNLDPEMAALVQQHLREAGASVYLADALAEFRDTGAGAIKAVLGSGKEIEAGLAILAIGVRPETELARSAGLAVGRGIKVNEYLQTSDPRIYALGDAVEVVDFVTGAPAVIPLAGPANKQGRIAANNIAGRREPYRGTQGTAVLKVFDLTVASTGAGERSLRQAGLAYRSCIVQPNSRAGYYPGGRPMVLKLLFSPAGAIYGAQAVGYSGVDKRIDVIAAALRAGQSVYALQELELAYAPPYSSAKDPVNLAGYVAGNILRGDVDVIHCPELLAAHKEAMQIIDVREPEEFSRGHIEGALNIPLGRLRERLGEIEPGREPVIYCAVGLRSYLAARILVQKGFPGVRSLDGGYRIYRALQDEKEKGGAVERPQ
jgi:NADPH-dependent 2,4-dienoyl-CoA reductase/sulfur reductase-like enzyme/rhodanese-related sulfurtransferase